MAIISASDRLCAPAEPASLRRLSDSMVCEAQDNLAKESETELGQLRQWASEAMKLRPDCVHQDAMTEEDDLSSGKTSSIRRAVSERSPSPSAAQSSARPSFLINGFHSRPTSMLARHPFLEQPAAHSLLASASTSSLERSASVRRKPAGRRIVSAPETSNEKLAATTLTPPALKSQDRKGSLPLSSDRDVETPSTSPVKTRRSQTRGLRLSIAADHSLLLSPDERTPRGKSNGGISSPVWTPSTSDSDDDKFIVMTPSEGQSPCQQRRQATSVSLSHHNLTTGLDSLGSSAEQTMQSMTGITLAGRRGSLPPSVNKSNRVSFALPTDTDSDSVFKTISPSLGDAHAINNSALFDVGSVNGITPPALRDHSTYSTDSPSSQVVSAGLEMGLGVTMAVSALSCNLPSTSTSSINIMAEPRFSHNAVPLSAHYAPMATGSDQLSREVSFARLDRDEAELARRRTTGSLAASKREAGIVGTRRHIRAGTHDPRGDSNASASSMSAPGSARLPEEAPHRIDELPLHLDTSDRIRQTQTSSSETFSAVSTADMSTRFGSTPTGTPFGSQIGMVSPDATTDTNRRSYISQGNGTTMVSNRKDAQVFGLAVAAEANGKMVGGLMGMGGGGHFGPGVRAKIAQVLDMLIEQIPLQGHDSETIQLVEFGSLNSRSSQLIQPIITAFVNKQARHSHQLISSQDTVLGDGSFQSTQSACQPLSFQVTHEDSSSADFRPLTQLLDHSSDSYMDPHWQGSHSPSLANSVFSSFVARPFASKIAPPSTFHLGMSLMDLHWIHTPSASVSPALTAQAELTAFLRARGSEFKKGGMFIMAYIARSEEAAGPSSQHKDIWTTLSNTLAPCIQRLVSCSMVKSDVARHLLDLPMHPRSAKQTKSVLQSLESIWEVEWSCGLENDAQGSSSLPSEALPLRLSHPAWKAYNSGTLSRVPFTEHMVQLFKNLYESHFRNVLRERGKLSKGAVEFVLDSLWDVLFSRIVDQDPSPMKDIEVEVSIVALRRR